MPDADQMRYALREYARRFSAGDREGWLDLFVDEPDIIEPANAPARHGRAPLEQSFDGVRAAGLTVELTPLQIIANGTEAAMHMQTRLTAQDGSVTQDSVIEIFSFEENGKIRRMKAFVPPDM